MLTCLYMPLCMLAIFLKLPLKNRKSKIAKQKQKWWLWMINTLLWGQKKLQHREIVIRKENTSILKRPANAEHHGWISSFNYCWCHEPKDSKFVWTKPQRNCCWESISGSGEIPSKAKVFGLMQGMGFWRHIL